MINDEILPSGERHMHIIIVDAKCFWNAELDCVFVTYFLWLCKYLKKVKGGWGEWSSWPECPVSCGGGIQVRSRVCDSPAPEFGGDDCTVDGSSDLETQACNEYPCPSMH